jgi:hypothetical protein
MVTVSDYIPRWILVTAFFTALISSAIDQFPSEIEPVVSPSSVYDLKISKQKFDYQEHGQIESNIFTNAEFLFVNQANGAEDMAISNDGRAFLSINDGRIVWFDSNSTVLHNFTRMGTDDFECGQLEYEPKCGRPLGLLFVPSIFFKKYTKKIKHFQPFVNEQVLLVADAYKGLYVVDAKGKKILVTRTVAHGGERFKFLNSLAFGKNGKLYMTDSSTRFHRNKVVLDLLEATSSGRLIEFDPFTGQVKILAKDLPFPNGIVLIENDQAILVALTFANKIVKYSFKTKKIIDFAFVPGPPDNLWLSDDLENDDSGSMLKKQQVFVGLVSRHTMVHEKLFTSIKMRRLLSFFPSWFLMRMISVSLKGAFVTINPTNGQLEKIYEDPTGKANFISGVHFYDGFYYLMSWYRNSIVRIPVSNLISLDKKIKN